MGARVVLGRTTSRASGFFALGKGASLLIDSLVFALEKSGCLERFWGKLDEGADAALAVAN